MIQGTGPGRGVPWWRSGRGLILRHVLGGEVPGLGVSLGRQEPDSRAHPREGRTVAVIGR